MATWYYWSKATKNKRCKSNNDFYDYYAELPEVLTKTKDDLHSKCRICLQKGTEAIFETEDESSEEVVEALQAFADIFISNQDEHPKLLCKTCYNFTKAAMLFRKTAKRAEELLRQPLKEETFLEQEDSHHSFNDNELSEIKPSEFKWPENTEETETKEKVETIKKEKAEKNKTPAKITCNICNKIINKSYYREHMTLHDSDQKKFVCDICGKSFRLRCAYRNHSIRHRNDFPHKCSFCPYRGRYAELLKTHMRTHTGDYRYMCTECPARFLFKSNLNSHMFKHKEPQHKCDTCKRAFHTTLALQRHFEADHLGIKNHVCNICGKAFGYRNAMMKHQRRVHKREKQLFGRMPSYLVAERKKQDPNNLQ